MQAMTELPRRITNPVTGDSIDFLASPLCGEGDTLVFRCCLPAGALGAPAHTHQAMTETFTVESGALEIQLAGGQLRRLGPGESIRLEPGTEHGFSNPLRTETHFLNVSTPGIELEKFLRAIYSLAAAGEAKADGMPSNPLALAVALASTDMTMSGFSPQLQRGAIGMLARIAEWTGTAKAVRRAWGPAGHGRSR